ncbi:hypothetical protein D3C87_2115460 [compost metagenome]
MHFRYCGALVFQLGVGGFLEFGIHSSERIGIFSFKSCKRRIECALQLIGLRIKRGLQFFRFHIG